MSEKNNDSYDPLFENPAELDSDSANLQTQNIENVRSEPLLTISVVEAEKLLEKAFSKFKDSRKSKKLNSKIVGDYWIKDYGAAPFLEEMTFKQLLSLDIKSFLDKRITSDKKVEGIIATIDKVIDQNIFRKILNIMSRK